MFLVRKKLADATSCRNWNLSTDRSHGDSFLKGKNQADMNSIRDTQSLITESLAMTHCPLSTHHHPLASALVGHASLWLLHKTP